MANPVEARGRELLSLPLRLIPRGPAPPVPPPPGAIRRVVVIRPDERIGNLLLLTPMIDALHTVWPGVRVDIVVGGAMAGLFEHDPRLADQIIFDKRALVRNPLGLISIARRLMAGRYDLAVDASHSHSFSLTSGLLVRATGACWRLGWRRGPGDRLLNCGLARRMDERPHTSRLYVDLLRVLAPGAAWGPLHLPVTPAEEAEARRRLTGAGWNAAAGGPVIGFHPGGRGAKRWPTDRFVAVARGLVADGATVILFHGPGEESILDSFEPGLAVRAPRLPLRLFAAALRACDLFVSSDTGPMHMAQAVGVPTLALFIVDNADMFGPTGPPHRVLFDPAGPPADGALRVARAMLAERPPLSV